MEITIGLSRIAKLRGIAHANRTDGIVIPTAGSRLCSEIVSPYDQ